MIVVPNNCNDRINLDSWPDYKYFTMKRGCTDLGIGVSTPPKWASTCPILYFPLDTANNGVAKGTHSADIQFMSGGIIGNAFINPYTPAYYDLGTYPNSSFCFPLPESCLHGMSLSFWTKIISQGDGKHGFITTASMDAPGFNVWWYDTGNFDKYKGFRAGVKRRNGAIGDLIFVNKTMFLGGNPYGTWFHSVMTYKYS